MGNKELTLIEAIEHSAFIDFPEVIGKAVNPEKKASQNCSERLFHIYLKRDYMSHCSSEPTSSSNVWYLDLD